MVDAELLKILACPACKKPVEWKAGDAAGGSSDDWLVCTACGRRYPVRDDIPIMLIEEAQMPESAGS